MSLQLQLSRFSNRTKYSGVKVTLLWGPGDLDSFHSMIYRVTCAQDDLANQLRKIVGKTGKLSMTRHGEIGKLVCPLEVADKAEAVIREAQIKALEAILYFEQQDNVVPTESGGGGLTLSGLGE